MRIRIVLMVALVAMPLALASAQSQRWERHFPETVNVLVLQNPGGRIEVEVSAAAGAIQVIVEPAPGHPFQAESVNADESAPGVVTLRVAEAGPVAHIRAVIPARVVLSAQSRIGEVTVRGIASRILAESESGNVVLHLPPNLDAEFSFKTTSGQVINGVGLAETAGKSGASGRPVIQARSATGSIVLLPLSGAAVETAMPRDDPPRPPRGPAMPGMRRAVARRDSTGADEKPLALTSRTAAAKKASKANASGTLRVNSDLVLVNAYVVDPQNSSVPNLAKEDFALTDAGKEQAISIFEPVHRPLDLFILLDLSGSTHSKFDVVKKAVKRFVDVMAPDDRIAIAAFTSRFMLISDFTNDRKLLKKRMDDTKNRRGGTEFYHAMWSSLDLLAELDSPRRAIVVMTDGVDNSLQGSRSSSPVGFEELLERIRADGVSIYPIYLNTEFQMVVKQGSGDSLQYKEGREQLQAIADACGTTMFRAERFEDLTGAYERVAAELRNLYTLGFYPTDRGADGDWRELAVRVNRPGATVRARKGYFVQ